MGKPIELRDREFLVGVIPEAASGPGWTNDVAWVIIANANGSCRLSAVQGKDLGAVAAAMFQAAEATHRAFCAAVTEGR